jgi:DNA replication protein DnaC
MIDFAATLKKIEDDFARSPHACTECGEKLLRADSRCVRCDEQQAADRVERERLASIRRAAPERYRWARFDASELQARVKDPTAIAKARDAAEGKLDRAVLTGPAGRGKTTLAVAMAVEIATRRNVVPYFASAIELATARGKESLGHEPELVECAMGADLCVIDDLGADKLTPQSAVVDVIHARHARMRPTIVTTGFGVEEIAARYGDGIARRVFEGAVVIDVRGAKR